MPEAMNEMLARVLEDARAELEESRVRHSAMQATLAVLIRQLDREGLMDQSAFGVSLERLATTSEAPGWRETLREIADLLGATSGRAPQ